MTWEDRLKQLMSPTENKFPYRVVQVKPNRKRDEEIYMLSGREEDIAANGSLFLALYDLAQRDRIDFDEWFEQWSLGFPQLNVNRETSNYPLLGNNQWRKPEARPRFRDLTPPELRHKLTYRTIEIWLNRELESESVILSGTDLQLVNHCIQLEYQGGGAQQASVIDSDVVRYSGIPQITLTFTGVDKSLPIGKQRVKGEKSFRYIGYTDNFNVAQKRQDLKLITQADIGRIGAKIKSVFKTTPPYIWLKGKNKVIYHNWQQGYNLNVYALNHAEGERLIASILSLQNHLIDEAFVKYSEAKNSLKAYPPVTTIQIMGQTKETPERLPKTEVRFQMATIYLPTLKQTLVIA